MPLPFSFDPSYAIDRDVNRVALEEALKVLAATQTRVSYPVPGCITPELTEDQVRTYGFALIAEVVEFVNELGWKPWKLKKEPDVNAVATEFADILAFLGLLARFAIVAGASPEALAAAYQAKTRLNARRIAGKVGGYGTARGEVHP